MRRASFPVWCMPLVAAGILTAVGWAVHAWIETSLQEKYTEELPIVLKTEITSVQRWVEQQRWAVEVRAQEPRVRALIREAVTEADHTDGSPAALLRSASLTRLREYLGSMCQAHGYSGFVVTNPQGVVVAARLDEPVGQANLLPANVMDRALTGQPVVSTPFLSRVLLPDELGVYQPNRPTMFAAAPVYDDTRRIIGVLGFRICPEQEFTDIVTIARLGRTGETYAFDATGMMLTNSRFAPRLDSPPMMPSQTDAQTILRVPVRHPMIDSSGHDRSKDPHSRQPSALGGDLSDIEVDVQGYRNYRGEDVIGAWVWLEDPGFAIATEIEVSEAYRPLDLVRRAYLFVLGWLIIAGAVALFFDLKNRRWSTRLRFSEQFCDAVVNSAANAWVITDQQGVVQQFNLAAERMFGYPQRDIQGRHIQVLLSTPSGEDILLAALTALSADRDASPAEATHELQGLDVKGNQFPIEARVHTLWRGTHSVFMVEFRDLSQQRDIEQKLRSHEMRTRAIVESVLDCIITIDLDGQIIEFNKAAEETFGYRRDQISGQKLVDQLIPPDHRKIYRRAMNRYLKAEEAGIVGKRFEAHALRADGASFPVELAVVANAFEGRPTGFTVYLRDLTERKCAEEALRDSEERYRSLIEANHDWIWSTDRQGRHTYCSPSVESILGHDPDELVGCPHDQHMHEDDHEQMRVLWSTSVRQKQGWKRLVYRWRHSDGSYRFLESGATPILDAGGQVVGFRGVARDVTQRVRAEENMQKFAEDLIEARNDMEAQAIELAIKSEQLAVSTAAAEAASRSKSEFLANMSHEIRTPMTAILGFADLLTDSNQTRSQRDDCINTIQRNGQHLLTLINDILDISKIEAGQMTVERIRCSPCQILTDVASMMKTRAASKGLSLDMEYVGDIPTVIQSDPTRLRQILVNLVGNAIKFTKQGGIRVVTRLIDPWDAPNPRVRFEVIDTGIGMTAEQLANVFDAFTQADTSTTRRFGGTGLGLTISKRLSEALGGGIEVSSAQGKGSCFTVTINTGPLVGVSTEENPGEVPNDSGQGLPLPSVTNTRLRGTILLAEDGPDNQRLLTHILTQAGAHVTVAGDGRIAYDTAIAALEAGHPFDLILMDMQMAELDGYTVTAMLREKEYRRPIVALTAHAMAQDREKCLAAGCDEFATKPIDRIKLLALVADYLHKPVEGASMPSDTPTHLPESSQPDQPTQGSPLFSDYADDPDMVELVEMFVDDLPSRVETIQRAVTQADLQALAEVSHQLKGAAGGYGFSPITDAAASVEKLAKAGSEIVAFQQSINELVSLCQRATSQKP